MFQHLSHTLLESFNIDSNTLLLTLVRCKAANTCPNDALLFDKGPKTLHFTYDIEQLKSNSLLTQVKSLLSRVTHFAWSRSHKLWLTTLSPRCHTLCCLTNSQHFPTVSHTLLSAEGTTLLHHVTQFTSNKCPNTLPPCRTLLFTYNTLLLCETICFCQILQTSMNFKQFTICCQWQWVL